MSSVAYAGRRGAAAEYEGDTSLQRAALFYEPESRQRFVHDLVTVFDGDSTRNMHGRTKRWCGAVMKKLRELPGDLILHIPTLKPTVRLLVNDLSQLGNIDARAGQPRKPPWWSMFTPVTQGQRRYPYIRNGYACSFKNSRRKSSRVCKDGFIL